MNEVILNFIASGGVVRITKSNIKNAFEFTFSDWSVTRTVTITGEAIQDEAFCNVCFQDVVDKFI